MAHGDGEVDLVGEPHELAGQRQHDAHQVEHGEDEEDGGDPDGVVQLGGLHA